jgi:hypothetical protein
MQTAAGSSKIEPAALTRVLELIIGELWLGNKTAQTS